MTLWYLEFRHFAPYDYNTPLMHIPVQGTFLSGNTEDDAKAELMKWAGSGDRIDVLACRRAPEWMQNCPRNG